MVSASPHDEAPLDDRARSGQDAPASGYERPEIIDYGTLSELTLSGSAPLSDAFGGAAGGGS
jgi:hypothetical protein